MTNEHKKVAILVTNTFAHNMGEYIDITKEQLGDLRRGSCGIAVMRLKGENVLSIKDALLSNIGVFTKHSIYIFVLALDSPQEVDKMSELIKREEYEEIIFFIDQIFVGTLIKLPVREKVKILPYIERLPSIKDVQLFN
jgi:hypothetical protein